MAVPIRQPHSITVVTPAVDQTDESGAGRLDYGSPFGQAPATSRSVKGMFQSRGGAQVIDDEGAQVPLDGIFFTTDTAIAVDDVMAVNLPGQASNYKVVGVEPKYDNFGKLSHNQVALVREIKR